MKKISALAIAGVFTASLAATAFAEMAEVKVGGEIRVRDVVTNNYDYSDKSSDRNNTVTQRTRVNVDAKIDETTKAYISLQDTRVWGQDTNGAGKFDTATTGNDGNAVDVSQAYVQLDQLFGQPLSLKLGRQVLAYGEHRLIGSFEWSNYARRFDALKLIYNTDAFSVDLWTAKVKEEGDLNGVGTEVPASATTTGNYTTNNEDGYFNGLYVTLKNIIPANTLDLYALQKTNTDAANDLNVLTYGVRLNGAGAGVDWTLEGALQTGEVNETVDKDASFYAIKAGYTVPNTPSLRIGAEYVAASGNEPTTTGADKDDEAFDQLYPTNHPLYGVSDVAATNTLSNLTAWSINVSAKPVKGLKLLAEYWNYETDEDYTITGTTSKSDKIGNEFNIQAWYALTSNVDLHAYWARFTPDSDFVGKTTAGVAKDDDPADNVTLQVAVKF